jgi:hypothetical protein
LTYPQGSYTKISGLIAFSFIEGGESRVKVLMLSLFGLLPILSSTLTVGSNGFTLTASATLTTPGTSAYDSGSYSRSYLLSVAGGTGTGFAFPGFTLNGVYNEAPYTGLWDLLGAQAQITIRGVFGSVGGYTGDMYGGADGISPSYSCGLNAVFFCGIPFTFDVPQTITVYASVQAALQPGRLAPSWSYGTVGGSVVFNSDALIADSHGLPDRAASAILTGISVPEPASWALAMAVFLAVLLRTRRTRHDPASQFITR